MLESLELLVNDRTVAFFTLDGHLELSDGDIQTNKWLSCRNALMLLKEVKPGGDRIGPLFVAMFFSDSSRAKYNIPSAIRFQVHCYCLRLRSIKFPKFGIH